jgi:hypothetical protein
MKQIFLFLAACLMMAACDNDAEFATRDTQTELLQPDGIEVAGLQAVSISYAADGEYMPALGCTDQGGATNTLATRGDLCVRMVITNTTTTKQTVNRRDFALDFDGRAHRTPTTLYNQQMRAVKYIEVAPESDTTVTLYYSGLMPAAYPQWAQMSADVNALYSIDIRLGIAAIYLVGFDLYATTGHDCWLNR